MSSSKSTTIPRPTKNTKTRLSIIALFVLLAVTSTTAYSTNKLAANWLSSTVSTAGPFSFLDASVATDKPDYAPGETAIITGSGFIPGETVRLHVVHIEGGAEPIGGEHQHIETEGEGHEPWDVIADGDGNISSTWYVHPDDSLGATFLLTARGQSSGLTAHTTFTDGNVKVLAEPGGTGVTTTATVDIAKYGSANCTGALLSINNNPKLNQPISSASHQSEGVAGSVGSIRFTASATGTTNNVAKVFLQWRALKGDDAFTYIDEVGTPSTTASTSICFADASNGQHTFYANYGTRLPTATTLAVDPATGPLGGTVTLTATSTAGGTFVANQTVNFSINGKPAGSAVTNASGVASVTNIALTDAGGNPIPVGTHLNYVRAESIDNADYYGAVSTNTLTVTSAPSITGQPQSAVKCVGDSVTFSVTASGLGTLTYQWWKDGATISGATASSYTISPVSAAHAGSYTVGVTNTYGTTTSSPATLTINTAPSITSQPQSATKLVGDGVSFSVTATGSNLTYQWRKGVVDIADATNSIYSIASVATTDAGNYDVVVSGGCGSPATSSAATLTVNKKMPVISWSNPADITYGTALSATQLNATAAYGSDSVAGTFTYTPVVGTVLNAGSNQTLSVTFTPTDASTYETPAPKTVSINVLKAAVTVTAGSYSGPYDGVAHATSACAVSGFDLTCTNNPASVGPGVSSGAVTATVDQNTDNFDVTVTPGSFSITKANAVCSVTGTTVTYNGAAHGASGTCVGVETTPADLSSLLNLGASFTNVPGGTANWTFTGGTNYNDQSGTAPIVINKAASTTVVTFEAAPYVYRGSAFTATANVTGAGSLNQPVAVVYSGDCTNVSSANGCTATATSAESDNHLGSTDAKSITITKAVSNTLVTVSNATYDGNPHGGTARVTGAGGLDQSLSVTYAGRNGTTYGPSTMAPTSAGSYTASASYAGDANHNGSSDSRDFSIGQKTLTVTAANIGAPAGGQYSDPLPTLTGTLTGVVGDDGITAAFTTTALQGSPAGNYLITPVLSDPNGKLGNYAVGSTNGTLTRSKEDTQIEYSGDTLRSTGSTSSNSATTLTMAGVVREEADGNLGDKLNTTQLKFTFFKNNDTAMTTAVSGGCTTGNLTYGVAGTASGSCVTGSLGADNYIVKVELLVNGYYLAPVENVAVTVALGGTGFTTGGGWLNEPNLNSRSNFGFTVKYLKGGNIQGNSVYIYRKMIAANTFVLPSGGGFLPAGQYNWIIKSNAMNGLTQTCTTTTPKICHATFSGKNNISAVNRLTGVAYSLGGNYNFQVDVTDKGEPGSSSSTTPDTYAIRVWDSTTGTYYQLGAATAQLSINGGNIQVRP